MKMSNSFNNLSQFLRVTLVLTFLAVGSSNLESYHSHVGSDPLVVRATRTMETQDAGMEDETGNLEDSVKKEAKPGCHLKCECLTLSCETTFF